VRREGSLDSQVLSIAKLQSRVAHMNVFVDFLNKHINDVSSYLIAYQKRLDTLLRIAFRSNSLDDCFYVLNSVIGIHKKCKFPKEYAILPDAPYAKLLQQEHALGLFFANTPSAQLGVNNKYNTLCRRFFSIYNEHDRKCLNVLGFRCSFKRR
jgi:hypothetical protein